MTDSFQDWSGRTFDTINLSNTRWRETMLVNARFSGLIDGLVINDVEVAPLIAAELDRRYPERTRLRPTSAAEAHDGWSVIEDLWGRAKARAASVPEATLHVGVDGEWSWCETFRHLIFVTDGWISRRALQRDEPHHPWGVPPSFLTGVPGIDGGADPTWDEIVPVREGRMATVRDNLDVVDLECLRTVLNEEWHHHWFANRDLDQLSPSSSG